MWWTNPVVWLLSLHLFALCGLGSAWIANAKSGSISGWFFCGFLLGPLGLAFAALGAGTSGTPEQSASARIDFMDERALVTAGLLPRGGWSALGAEAPRSKEEAVELLKKVQGPGSKARI